MPTEKSQTSKGCTTVLALMATLTIFIAYRSCDFSGPRAPDLPSTATLPWPEDAENRPVEQSKFGGLSQYSNCQQWNAAALNDRRDLILELARGTGRRTGRDYVPFADDIYGCISTALKTPCPDPSIKIDETMAACMVLVGAH